MKQVWPTKFHPGGHFPSFKMDLLFIRYGTCLTSNKRGSSLWSLILALTAIELFTPQKLEIASIFVFHSCNELESLFWISEWKVYHWIFTYKSNHCTYIDHRENLNMNIFLLSLSYTLRELMEWVKISPISFQHFWANLGLKITENIFLIISPSVRKFFVERIFQERF